jgi:glycosyltransferase involved in cell wall biosynthesis
MIKKKILIFSHEFPPLGGGAGVVAKDYAQLFTNEGFDVTVLTTKRKNIDFDVEYKLKTIKTFKKVWFISYINAVDFNNYDKIILNDVAAACCAGIFFTKKQFSKSIVFLHGSEPENIFENPSLFKRISRFKYFYTKALMNVNKIIAVSQFMKEKFITRTKLYELEDKISIVYTSIDPKVFYRQEDKTFKTKFNIPNDAKVLLSVSRIVEGKGYFQMFEIFKNLLEEDENYIWIVIGEGDYLDKLKELVRNAKIESYVIFLGSINRKNLRYYYSNSDLFWLLSNFDESFGLVYLEAQACGLPAIGRNKAGVKEAIKNGKSGFLVNNKGEVIDILKNKKYLDLKKEDILKFANRFSLDKQVNVLEKVI